MAVDDPLKPVVATKEAKPNYVEHLIGPGDDAEEGEIVDGDVDKSGNPQFLNRIRWSICGLSTVPLFIR
ncbi:unnamed protein product [Brassica rapa]|uniref:Uncharacterized protein n=1 Tax=Brassica campestris TaxID=3711 RepID=M4FJ82_BRACM|nr:unnamed protein product [Brassica rapa]